MGCQTPATYFVAMVTNHSDTSITPLSYTVLSPYLVWRLFGMIGISQIPHCYSN